MQEAKRKQNKKKQQKSAKETSHGLIHPIVKSWKQTLAVFLPFNKETLLTKT